MIITRTPFRISFFGGGTDFPGYYLEHGGAVLATGMNQYAFLSVHELGPYFKHHIKANYAKAEMVDRPEDIQHPLIRESLLKLGISESLEISHVSDLPGRTGIGSSSSFTVGLLHALHCLRGNDVTAEQLALEAIDVERNRVKDTGGHQDQVAAAHGGFLRIDFKQGGGISTKQLEISVDRSQELQDSVMLFFTGLESSAETILSEQNKRTKDNLSALHDMKQMVDEAQRVLCGYDDLTNFGKLLHETWTIKKSLADGITNSFIDEAYETAMRAGASGGKLLGAGGRGFLLIFAKPELHQKIRGELSGMAEVDIAFSKEGSKVIFNTMDARHA